MLRIVLRLHAALALVTPVLGGPSLALPPGFEVHPFVSGLHTNTSMAWLPDGAMLCNEVAVVSFPLGDAAGRIRVVHPDGTLEDEPLYTTPADLGNGLSGIALDPDFAANHWLYVYVALPGNATHELRRLHLDASAEAVDEDLTIAMFSPPAPQSSWHGQTNMQFGPDGLLYIDLGDGAYETASPELAVPPPQDPSSFFGKVFHLDVHDLPFDLSSPEALTVARGFRNPFGLAIHPVTGSIWVTENGPLVDDELDLVVQGGNCGWPLLTGSQSSPGFLDPAHNYAQIIAPIDCTFSTGTAFPAEYHDNLFFGDFVRGGFHRVVIGGAALDTYVSEELWFDGRPFGNLTSAAEGPDGALYFAAQVVPYSTDADTTIYRITYVTEPTGLTL